MDKIDEFGKPAWIALTILAFWLAWPVGIAMLIFLAYSGRFRGCRSAGRWYFAPSEPSGEPPGGNPWGHHAHHHGCGWRRSRRVPSGNAAFDEYRAETLRRLEEEQREFMDYLERLRRARDKEEFDRFMAERRNRPPAPAPDTPV